MAEPSFSNMTDMVLGKSQFLSFSQVCMELGLPNDMEWLLSNMSDIKPRLMNVQEEQAFTQQFRLWWLNLKTHLYNTEDMLDNLDTLREVIIKATKSTQGKVGESGDISNLLQGLDDPTCAGRNRGDLEQRMRTQERPRQPSEIAKQGRFMLTVICCGLLFAFVVLMLEFHI